MDGFAISYLVSRFFYRIYVFFRDWYVDGSRAVARAFMATLEYLDRSLAVKITLQHFFEPLYKDYSIIGRVLGIVFRSIRVVLGAVIYALIGIAFAAVYLVWIIVPPTILFLSFWRLR